MAQPNDIRMYSLESDNRTEFTETLCNVLCEKFGTTIENLPENYGFSKPWSLLKLIITKEIDTYQILYVNNIVWAGSGGIVREYAGKCVYQAGFRGFARAKSTHMGLGSRFFIHEYNTPYQISRAIENKCESVILSFNEHNYKLFQLTKNHIIPKALLPYKFVPSPEPVMFNGVLQWILEAELPK